MKEVFKKYFIIFAHVVVYSIWYLSYRYSIYTVNFDLFWFLIDKIEILSSIVGLLVLVMWATDKRYKILYFLAYVITINVIFYITGKMLFKMGRTIEVGLFIALLHSFVMQLIYNYFKKLSYKKYF